MTTVRYPLVLRAFRIKYLAVTRGSDEAAQPRPGQLSERGDLARSRMLSCSRTPYLLYELDRMSNDHVPVTVVDRLEAAADRGDTLRPLDRVIQDVRELPADTPCPLSADLRPVVRPHLAPIVDEPTWRTAARLYISVVLAAALDPPRGALPDRVGVQQQRQHHRRLMPVRPRASRQ